MSTVPDFFKHKTIWITGASSGIGEALAFELAALDVQLILSGRNSIYLEEVALTCKEKSATIKTVAFDLSEKNRYANIVQMAHRCYEKIDIVILAAGVSQRSKIVETREAVIDTLLAVNAISQIKLSTEIVKYFNARDAGHLVYIGSLAGYIPTPLRSVYSATKSALHSFYQSLATELLHTNIKFQLVVPGFVNTNISMNALTANGKRYNVLDDNQTRGMDAHKCARGMLQAMTKRVFTQFIGLQTKGVLALLLLRIAPNYLRKQLAKRATT